MEERLHQSYGQEEPYPSSARVVAHMHATRVGDIDQPQLQGIANDDFYHHQRNYKYKAQFQDHGSLFLKRTIKTQKRVLTMPSLIRVFYQKRY